MARRRAPRSGLFQAIAWLQDAADRRGADPAQVLAVPRSVPDPPPSAGAQRVMDHRRRRRQRTHTRVDHPTRPPSWSRSEEVVRVSGALLEQVLSPLTTLVVSRTESRFRTDRLQQLGEVAGDAGAARLLRHARRGRRRAAPRASRPCSGAKPRRCARTRAAWVKRWRRWKTTSTACAWCRWRRWRAPLLLAVRDASVRTDKEVQC